MPSSSAMNDRRTRLVVSMTSSSVSGCGRMPAAMLEMHEMPEHLDAHVTRRRWLPAPSTCRPRRRPSVAKCANFGRRLVARPGDGDVDAMLDRQARSRARPRSRARAAASNRPPTCRESAGRTDRRSGRSADWCPRKLMWSSITISAPWPNRGVDAAGGVREDERLHAEPRRARASRTSPWRMSWPS